MSIRSASKPLRILISGAGIAGPVNAFWLNKLGADVTVVERVNRLRKEGQTIDVRNEGREIFESMGIMPMVKAATTKELGLQFVDVDGGIWGEFPEDGSDSFTSEIEIVRGELASILYEETKKDINYVFGDDIKGIDQDDSGVTITFGKDGTKEKFDILVIADGLTSRTRALAFQQDVRHPIKPLNEWIAGFSFPKGENDTDWAQWYNAPGRRVILHRPDGFGRMRSGFAHIDHTETTRLIGSSKTSVENQKEYWADLYKDAGWESQRLIKGMMESDDFYMYEVAQIKMEKWSKGRVVLIGDAASCPSPISGQGSNVAVVQAYVLAAMIAKHGSNFKAAFHEYESSLRPWVEGIQNLPPGVPGVAVPNSSRGIFILHCITYFGGLLVRSGIANILKRWFGASNKMLPLPSPSLFDGVER